MQGKNKSADIRNEKLRKILIKLEKNLGSLGQISIVYSPNGMEKFLTAESCS